MPGLNVGEILSVTYMGRLFDQRVMNVLHYRVTIDSTDATYEGAADKLAYAMASGTQSPGLSMLAAQGSQYVLETVRVQRLTSTRLRYVERAFNLPGTHAGQCSTPNVSAVIVKKGASVSRRALGTFHLPGIPETGYAEGYLTNTYTGLMVTIATKILNTVTPVLEALTVQPIIWTPTGNPVYYPLMTANVIPTLRIMKRRTVGLGI